MDEGFIRRRITELRLEKGVSEYRMSTDLGHSKGYIQSITSGRALPSMTEFLYLCDYFGITPGEFFNDGAQHALLRARVNRALDQLADDDLALLAALAEKLAAQGGTGRGRRDFL